MVETTEIHSAIEAVWRIESARLIAGLTRIVRDVGRAEELAQDALVAALEQWPESGIPENPGAWLMATAKHRAIDHFRRNALIDRKHEELGRDLTERENAVPDLAAAIDDTIGDDLLRLVFIACHPVLSTESRVALTLRLLGGLPLTRLRVLTSPPNPPSRSESFAPSEHSRKRMWLSRCRAERSSRHGCRQCCRWFI